MDFCPTCRRIYQNRHEYCSVDGAATRTIGLGEDPLVGLVFDERYELVRSIGTGGNGVVYLARQVGLERVVAFKMMYAERMADAAAVKRFAREARALAALDHAGCVRVLDYRAPEDAVPYLVMDLVEGHPLNRIISTGGIPYAHAVLVARQIAEAVGAAHAAGIVHRDLKPENVILDVKNGELRVRLIDFGLAIVVEDADPDKRLTRAGRVLGTPEYMSPEQIRGADAEARSDLYSLGVILYELVTGFPPFHGGTPPATVAMHLEDAPAPLVLPDLDPPLVARLQAIIFHLLEKRPEDRPRDSDEVVSVLRALHGELPNVGAASRLVALIADRGLDGVDTVQIDGNSAPAADPFLAVANDREAPAARREVPRALKLAAGALLGLGALLAVGLAAYSMGSAAGESAPPTALPDAEEQPEPEPTRVTVERTDDDSTPSSALPTAGTVEVPGGEAQLRYETALRALSVSLSARGLRPRDVRTHPSAARAWSAQSLAARRRDYGEADAQLDALRAVADSMSPREWMAFRLRHLERRLGDPPPPDSAARVRALWGTLEGSAGSAMGVRRFMQRLDTLEAGAR